MEFEPLSNTLDIPILPTIDDIYIQEIIQKDNLNSDQAEKRMDYIIESTSQHTLENNSEIPTEYELLNELITRINPNLFF